MEDFRKIKALKSVYEFDRLYRARFFHYNSAHKMYRDVSCDRFIPSVSIPFTVLLSNDDPITKVENVPHADLLRNPNCVLVEANHGGHCDFFTQTPNGYTRFWIEMLLEFLSCF